MSTQKAQPTESAKEARTKLRTFIHRASTEISQITVAGYMGAGAWGRTSILVDALYTVYMEPEMLEEIEEEVFPRGVVT